MDNLDSHTYEVFEKDPVKYKEYEEVYLCKLNLLFVICMFGVRNNL